jgi:hypothetical protein
MYLTKCIVLILQLVLLCSCRNGTDTEFVRDFDLDSLEHLESWRGPTLPQDAQHRYLLVIYFDQVHCRTCVQRELLELRDFYKSHGNLLDVAVVVFDPATLSTGRHPFLHDMKRVGAIPGPILLERVKGEADLGNQFNISLIDRERHQIRLNYFPRTEIEGWSEFERKLVHILTAK